MRNRLYSAAALALSALALAACGGGDDEVTREGGGAARSEAVIQAGIKACKDTIDAQPSLDENLKEQMKRDCEGARSRDGKAAKQSAAEICRESVEKAIPKGQPGHEQAIAACGSAP